MSLMNQPLRNLRQEPPASQGRLDDWITAGQRLRPEKANETTC